MEKIEVLHTFVKEYRTNYGEDIYIVGSTVSLGEWNPSKAIRMDCKDDNYWVATLPVPLHTFVEYKYFIAPYLGRNPRNSSQVRWIGDHNEYIYIPLRQHFVKNYRVNYGEGVYLSGSTAALGKWDPSQAIRMDCQNEEYWVASLDIPLDECIEYKYFIAPYDLPYGGCSHWQAQWIGPQNQSIHIPIHRKNNPHKSSSQQKPETKKQVDPTPANKIDPKPVFTIVEPKQLVQLLSNKVLTQQLKIIELKHDNPKEKLRVQGVKEFCKISLPNVTTINLQDNQIGDKGVQVLSNSSNYPQLKEIELNDNSITTTGVTAIINNKWSKEVIYKLDTVKTKDDGFAFQVGTSITTIKYIVENKGKLNFDFIEKQETKDLPHLMRSLDLLMEVPLEGKPEDIAAESKNVETRLIQESSQNTGASTVMLELKNIFGQSGDVVFSEKSNAKSKVSTSFILCGGAEKRLKIKHRMVDSAWKFDQLTSSNSKLLDFEAQYKGYLARQFGANESDIVLHKVTKGSTVAWLSVSQDNFLVKNSSFTQSQDLCVKPFFQSFNISPEDFDSRGNYTFPECNQTNLQERAGLPYFQPVYCSRFGLNISKKYDNGSDEWLMMNGSKGQWAVAFHGINYPANIVPTKNKTVLECIMGGREQGEMLIAGPAQACAGHIAVNRKNNELVGNGIYCTPRYTTSLLSYAKECNQGRQKFYVMLQCRIKPEALKCTAVEDYWVINQSKNIRPYGLILITAKQKDTIQRLSNSLYPKPAHWNNWKQRYQEFRQAHGLPY